MESESGLNAQAQVVELEERCQQLQEVGRICPVAIVFRRLPLIAPHRLIESGVVSATNVKIPRYNATTTGVCGVSAAAENGIL